ncbi:hypothetical protein DPMN_166146 [Dreissena polymorpha]|uniref:Uncharacterized protein n=1 Tax=Dreissena polymorpha TaxID=45954 RepID=A0A9D4EY55_DREPO|nr:hypothetical protein DPMN_166146 [Dreissena polymorpha]
MNDFPRMAYVILSSPRIVECAMGRRTKREASGHNSETSIPPSRQLPPSINISERMNAYSQQKAQLTQVEVG